MSADPPTIRELVDKVREKLYSSGLDERGMTEVRAIPVANSAKAARLEIFFGNVCGFEVVLAELPRCEKEGCGKPFGAHDWVALVGDRYFCGEHAKTCTVCSDSHRMTLGERDVPCTFCPRPCEACRGFYQGVRLGAYCETTPCPCSCHEKPAVPVSLTPEVERALKDGSLPIDASKSPRRARRRP